MDSLLRPSRNSYAMHLHFTVYSEHVMWQIKIKAVKLETEVRILIIINLGDAELTSTSTKAILSEQSLILNRCVVDLKRESTDDSSFIGRYSGV